MQKSIAPVKTSFVFLSNLEILITIKLVLMIKKPLQAVEEFHKAFQLGINSIPIASLDENTYRLRYNLMKEENEEYLQAAEQGDLVEIGDALGDMLYILCGTIISHGFQDKIEAIFDEIQNSNMSKLGADGKPIYREDGKVLKGPNYFKPNLKKIILEED
jgi:predicted HAD superfamily Cof-like phosphohydrolase